MKKLAVLAIAVFMIVGCASNVWVKPGGTTDEFNKDKYACMQESQQPVSSTYVNRYAGVSTSDVQTNESLFSACMNARGWSLQAQSQPIAPATRSTEPPSPDPQQEQMIRAEKSRQWTKYAKDAKGHFFYYDVTSLSLSEGQYATVREWLEYSSEAAGTENLSHVWRTSTINCKDNLIQFTHFLILDNKGQIRKRQTDTTEWKAVPAGSAMSILSNKICTNIK